MGVAVGGVTLSLTVLWSWIQGDSESDNDYELSLMQKIGAELVL